MDGHTRGTSSIKRFEVDRRNPCHRTLEKNGSGHVLQIGFLRQGDTNPIQLHLSIDLERQSHSGSLGECQVHGPNAIDSGLAKPRNHPRQPLEGKAFGMSFRRPGPVIGIMEITGNLPILINQLVGRHVKRAVLAPNAAKIDFAIGLIGLCEVVLVLDHQFCPISRSLQLQASFDGPRKVEIHLRRPGQGETLGHPGHGLGQNTQGLQGGQGHLAVHIGREIGGHVQSIARDVETNLVDLAFDIHFLERLTGLEIAELAFQTQVVGHLVVIQGRFQREGGLPSR